MPKKMNTTKAAAAVYQNAKAIAEAKRSGGTFGAVTRSLGNRGFEIHLGVQDKGTQRLVVQATPRSLFQGGKKAPIRIAVGHVVLLAGEVRAKGDQRAQLPLEIVARLDSKEEIRELIKLGLMSSAVLGIAETAGAVETAPVAQEDIFESDGEDEDFWTAGLREAKGGLKQQRQAAETVATIAARVATLKSQKGRKGIDGGVETGDVADPTLFSEPDYERFQRWRAHKAAAPKASVGGGGAAVAQPEATQTMAELMAQFKLEKEAAAAAAERQADTAAAAAAAKVVELKAWVAKQGAKENWDDEDDAVRMEDL